MRNDNRTHKHNREKTEKSSNSRLMVMLTLVIVPLRVFHRIFIRFPSEESKCLGVFRAVFYFALLCCDGEHNWLDNAEAYADARGGFAGGVVITVAMLLVLYSYIQFVLGLLLITGMYEGRVIKSGNRTVPYAQVKKILQYRDSRMSGMSYDGKLKELAQTGFLGAGGLDGGDGNTKKTMAYLNAKLGNYSYEGGLNFIKSFYGKK